MVVQFCIFQNYLNSCELFMDFHRFFVMVRANNRLVFLMIQTGISEIFLMYTCENYWHLLSADIHLGFA